MHIDRDSTSLLVIDSPKNKNAIIVAKIGEVLLRKATFDKLISFTAVLKMKKVIVPVIARIITRRH